MTSEILTERAPAKVNLTLHVVGRRADGYHELESLVVFAGVGDILRLVPGPSLGLQVGGETAEASGPPERNLVLRAAASLDERVPGLRSGQFHLTKRLPAAAGIGGGSSDAAAALRLLARLNALPHGAPALIEAARAVGADVPVCLSPRATMMRGIGEALSGKLPLPPVFAVLVNPRVAVPTADVFRALGLAAGERLGRPVHAPVPAAASELVPMLRAARNDLEAPAMAVEGIVAQALERVAGTDACRLARMSGSGATVFGLYDDRRATLRAARALRSSEPGWWIRPTILR